MCVETRTIVECLACDGEGWPESIRCDVCYGRGYVTEEAQLIDEHDLEEMSHV